MSSKAEADSVLKRVLLLPEAWEPYLGRPPAPAVLTTVSGDVASAPLGLPCAERIWPQPELRREARSLAKAPTDWVYMLQRLLKAALGSASMALRRVPMESGCWVT